MVYKDALLVCRLSLHLFSCAVQKAFSWNEYHVSIFAFIACAFGVVSKKKHYTDQSQGAFPLYCLLIILWFQVLNLSF